MTEEALDSGKSTLAGGAVGNAGYLLADLVGRDRLDRDVTQDTAEGPQVAAVGPDGIGR
jgi:hypothetical protein